MSRVILTNIVIISQFRGRKVLLRTPATHRCCRSRKTTLAEQPIPLLGGSLIFLKGGFSYSNLFCDCLVQRPNDNHTSQYPTAKLHHPTSEMNSAPNYPIFHLHSPPSSRKNLTRPPGYIGRTMQDLISRLPKLLTRFDGSSTGDLSDDRQDLNLARLSSLLFP